MKGIFEKRRLAATALMILAGMLVGYGAAGARGAGKPGQTDRQQVAAIAAERDATLAALADARMRHRIAQRGIARLVEELADTEKINESLRRELELRPAAGTGGTWTGGPMQ